MIGKQHLKINSESFMPLTIENIGEGMITPFGRGHYTAYAIIIIKWAI